MCGIAGIASPNHDLNQLAVESVVRMAAQLRHRGPDGSGVFAGARAVLACERLAIVDPEHGNQPVFDESRQVSVVFNGEIYNHLDLRQELLNRGHTFRSCCDSEVLVHLYEEAGPEMLKRLEGQFAFALWDANKRCLLLARDRFGICPLFYLEKDDGIVFASEIKAILATGFCRPELDESALAEVICLGTSVAPRTMFRSIRALPPAHLLMVDPHGRSTRRYWELDIPRQHDRSVLPTSTYIAGLTERIDTAVRRTIAVDVPVGTFLSGGLDSSLIASAAAQAAKTPFPAFSIGSRHRVFDESQAAARAANHVGASLETIIGDEELIAQNFEKLIQSAETPVLSTEAAALMALSARAQAKVKVILTGEGADEAFGGYLCFRQHRVIGLLNGHPRSFGRNLVRWAAEAFYGSDYLLPSAERCEEIRTAVGSFPAQAYEFEFCRAIGSRVLHDEHWRKVEAYPLWQSLPIKREAIAGRHWFDQSLYLGYQIMLPNYLLGPHGDRAMMANSVEGRYPFLDRELVEYAAQIPPRLKLRWLTEKYILRRAARRWLPETIATIRKKRFMTPFGGPFIGPHVPRLIRELLAPDTLLDYGYFDPGKVGRVIHDLQRPREKSIAKRTRSLHERLALGMALTLVVSMQLFHHLFLRRKTRVLSLREMYV